MAGATNSLGGLSEGERCAGCAGISIDRGDGTGGADGRERHIALATPNLEDIPALGNVPRRDDPPPELGLRELNVEILL